MQISVENPLDLAMEALSRGMSSVAEREKHIKVVVEAAAGQDRYAADRAFDFMRNSVRSARNNSLQDNGVALVSYAMFNSQLLRGKLRPVIGDAASYWKNAEKHAIGTDAQRRARQVKSSLTHVLRRDKRKM